MPSYDKLLHDENVRMALRLNFFHMLERKDLEDELKRLEEKHQRYLKCINENTERTIYKINKIKEYLNT
jgi:DNA gyrase/topoisomerase IV subunit A